MRVCVVGAGPSGLVAAKTLREQGHNPVVFEESGSVGGAFRHKAYVDCRLVSSKFITAFSDFRMPPEAELHPSIPQYVEYLEAYVEHFQLRSLIRFHAPVRRVTRNLSAGSGLVVGDDGTAEGGDSGAGRAAARYRVELGDGATEWFDAVAVCSGLHNVPQTAPAAALSGFAGRVLHSSEYKDPAPFRNRRVLIVGAGETGMDLAFQAVHATDRSVSLCVRNGFLSIPHQVGDLALDTLITNLGECAYQHRWVEAAKLKWRVSTWFIRAGLLLGTGTSSGYHQWVGQLPHVRRGHYIINKQCKAMPYLNRAAKRRWPRWAGVWAGVGDPDDPSRPGIVLHRATLSHADGDTVYFSDGTSVQADVVLLATGYKQRFPFLYGRGEAGAGLDSHDGGDADDPLPSQRLICDPADPYMAFLGFVRPNVGAIPPMAELQCLWWLQRLERPALRARRLATPTYELLSQNDRTRAYAVDYGAYMHDLARDIGAAPDLLTWWWLSHPRAFLAYCLGQSYVSLFRLRGPLAPASADGRRAMERVAEGELFRTVAERGVVMNAVFGATALAFTAVNIAALAVEIALWWQAARVVFLLLRALAEAAWAGLATD